MPGNISWLESSAPARRPRSGSADVTSARAANVTLNVTLNVTCLVTFTKGQGQGQGQGQ